MKPTHQVLIEKIMEKFMPTEHEENGKKVYTQGFTYMTQQGLESIYNEFLEELEEDNNSVDAIFEQVASIETEITGTVDKIVDEINAIDGKKWDGSSQNVAERGYESVKKLITAVQENAIKENREMIRKVQDYQSQFSKGLQTLRKETRRIKDFLNDTRLD